MIQLFWIPGHMDITGKEKADGYTKRVTMRSPELILLPYKDG